MVRRSLATTTHFHSGYDRITDSLNNLRCGLSHFAE
jgi:hypothetical protein